MAQHSARPPQRSARYNRVDMIPPQKKKGGPSYDGHQTEKSVGEVLVPGLAITRLRVIFRLQSHIRERASTVTDTGQHHHDQLACDLGMRVGNACIVHVVVLELTVLVRLHGPPGSIVITQFHELVTDIASPRPHGRSLSSAKALRREGGRKAALKEPLLGPLLAQPARRQGPGRIIR
jgi:hypothetical protein